MNQQRPRVIAHAYLGQLAFRRRLGRALFVRRTLCVQFVLPFLRGALVARGGRVGIRECAIGAIEIGLGGGAQVQCVGRVRLRGVRVR